MKNVIATMKRKRLRVRELESERVRVKMCNENSEFNKVDSMTCRSLWFYFINLVYIWIAPKS